MTCEPCQPPELAVVTDGPCQPPKLADTIEQICQRHVRSASRAGELRPSALPVLAAADLAPVVLAVVLYSFLVSPDLQAQRLRGGASARLDARRLDEASAGDYTEGEEIQQQWHTEVLWWSWFISALGAYVAFTTTLYIKRVRNTRWYWPFLTQAGLALGVCAVWCMHFVGMRALVLETDGKPQVVIGFEPLFSIVSALAAWLISCIALHMIIGLEKADACDELPPMMGRTATLGSSTRSLPETLVGTLKTLPKMRLFFAASLVAVGVVVMHYMGMLSQSGNFTMQFHPFPVAASMFLAGFAASVTLPIFAFDFDGCLWRVLSACGVGVCVNGMHYTGMGSAIYFYHGRHTGIFGESTIAWRFYYKDVVAFALMLNLVLMSITGFYVEVAREFIKQEEMQIEEKLQFEEYTKQTKGLIKRSRIMRYPMSLVRYSTFAKMKRLRPHEALKNERKLWFVDTVKEIERIKKDHVIVFFSHQWLDDGYPDPQNKHYNTMMTALDQLAKVIGAPVSSMLVFVDYCSIPQEGPWVQQLAIDSLATYVALSTSIVIVAPQIFCTVLSSLREKRRTMFPGASDWHSGADTDTTSNNHLHNRSHLNGSGLASPTAHNPHGGGASEGNHDLIILDDEEETHRRELYHLPGSPNVSEHNSNASPASPTLPVRPTASATSHLFYSSLSDSMCPSTGLAALGPQLEVDSQDSRKMEISGKQTPSERSYKSTRSNRSSRSNKKKSPPRARHSSSPSGISPVVIGKASEMHPQRSEVTMGELASNAPTGLTMMKAMKTKTRFTDSQSMGVDTTQTEGGMPSLNERQRVFLIQGTELTRVHFFDKDGQIRKKFEHLTDVYGGRTTCCDLGHPWGPDVCDRHRVVESLCGAYGGMLQDLRRLQRRSRSGKSKSVGGRMGSSSSAGDIHNDGRVKLVEEMIKKRRKIFPEKYFSTRIDAVHEYFKTHENLGNTRRNSNSEDNEASAAETPVASRYGSDTELEEEEHVVVFDSKGSKDDSDSSDKSSESGDACDPSEREIVPDEQFLEDSLILFEKTEPI